MEDDSDGGNLIDLNEVRSSKNGSGAGGGLFYRHGDMALPLIERDWHIEGVMPNKAVFLLSGEGAVGKSLLLLQLCVATVLGRPWIGLMPKQGPALYINCEDDEDEVARRLEDIARFYGVTREEIVAAGLAVVSLAGHETVMATVERNNVVKQTALFNMMRTDALGMLPVVIVVDNVANVFAGDEINRSQTMQFVTLLRGLALDVGCSVVLASHPSVRGIESGTGSSGSTAWHNSVRARAYFKAADPKGDDKGLRIVEFMKSNYGPLNEETPLRWKDGVFQLEGRMGSLQQMAQDSRVDGLFLTLLRTLKEQGRNVTDITGTSYAPAIFAKQPPAMTEKVTGKMLEQAMQRLLYAGRIRRVTEGPPSRQRSFLMEVERHER